MMLSDGVAKQRITSDYENGEECRQAFHRFAYGNSRESSSSVKCLMCTKSGGLSVLLT